MIGLILPASTSGHTFSRNARAISALNSTDRGRSVEPWVPPAQHVHQVHGGFRSAEGGDDHDAPVVRERLHLARHVVARHHVEHYIDALAAGERLAPSTP